MAKRKNVFTDNCSEALDNLSHLFHASSTSSWIVKQAVKIGKRVLRKPMKLAKHRSQRCFWDRNPDADSGLR